MGVRDSGEVDLDQWPPRSCSVVGNFVALASSILCDQTYLQRYSLPRMFWCTERLAVRTRTRDTVSRSVGIPEAAEYREEKSRLSEGKEANHNAGRTT